MTALSDDTVAELIGFLVKHGLTTDHLEALRELATAAVAKGAADERAAIVTHGRRWIAGLREDGMEDWATTVLPFVDSIEEGDHRAGGGGDS